VSPRVIELTIREGRNRQVRRMAEAIGNEVLELERIRFASLGLGDLPEGEARLLRDSELRRLWKDAADE
jgi:23S rRNA pseudouridine2605 synthase